MENLYAYNVSSTCILGVVLIYYFTQKKMPVLQNKIFAFMTLVAFLSCIMDNLFTYFIKIPGKYSTQVVSLFGFLYFLFRNLLPIGFAIYVVELTDTLRSMNKIVRWVFWSVAGLSVGTLLMQPFAHLVFDVRDGIYYRGPLLWVLYATALFFLLFSIGYAFHYRSTIKKIRKKSIYTFPIAAIGTSMIQMLFPSVCVESLGISLCILMIYFSIQKPEELLDSKTKLWNQSAFYLMIERRFRGRNTFQTIILEIDGLDFYRATLGITYSDHILESIADYIRQFEKEFWIYYMERGTFFLVQLREGEDELHKVIDMLTEHFKSSWNIRGNDLTFHTHICLVECPRDAKSPEEILNYSDGIRRKEHIGNPAVFYASDIDLTYIFRRKAIEQAIQRAIEQNTFEVFYQPIYSARKKGFDSAEALIRLKDEQLGYISPEEFIPIAEQNGTIYEIGRIVLDSVCSFLAEKNPEQLGISYVEVNLSMVQCMDSKLARQVMDILDKYKIEPRQINLEITETAAVHSPEILKKNVDELMEKGITFSMDDYGTGYSNMNYMITLPFEIVKIDKSIVWAGMEKGPAQIALNSLISLSKEMKMKIVAEGVETKEQVERLISLGCDYLQGYYFSKPVPAEEFLTCVRKFRGELEER